MDSSHSSDSSPSMPSSQSLDASPSLHPPHCFRHSIYIGLNYVDVAGVIFFPKLYEMTQQTFEAFFLPNERQKYPFVTNAKKLKNTEKVKNLSHFIHTQNIFPLVVHSESDYFLPIRQSDEVDILMRCVRLGRSSFTLDFQFFLRDDAEKVSGERALVASAKIIHALVHAKTRRAEPMNDAWREKLELLFEPERDA